MTGKMIFNGRPIATVGRPVLTVRLTNEEYAELTGVRDESVRASDGVWRCLFDIIDPRLRAKPGHAGCGCIYFENGQCLDHDEHPTREAAEVAGRAWERLVGSGLIRFVEAQPCHRMGAA